MDINKPFPKNNYPTPFIDQIIDECAESEVLSFMDGFFSYIHINILPIDQQKTALIFRWGTFSYRKLPFGLKNAGVTFQRAIAYAFHDIKHIVQPYLDDLPAHSTFHRDHSTHLRAIFILVAIIRFGSIHISVIFALNLGVCLVLFYQRNESVWIL